jgi:hypothetical protein
VGEHLVTGHGSILSDVARKGFGMLNAPPSTPRTHQSISSPK